MKMPGMCGLRPYTQTHLKKGLVLHLPVRWGTRLGLLTNTAGPAPASCRGFFSGVSDIRTGRLISSSLRGPSSHALTLLGAFRFIAWCLRRPSLGECRRGPRYSWSHRARLSHGPVSGPTLKRPCATLVGLVGCSSSIAGLATSHFDWPCLDLRGSGRVSSGSAGSRLRCALTSILESQGGRPPRL